MFGLFKGGTKGGQIPQVTPRSGEVRNINVMHKGGNKFTVTLEVYNGHRWAGEKKVISPGISGFTAGNALLDVSWSSV